MLHNLRKVSKTTYEDLIYVHRLSQVEGLKKLNTNNNLSRLNSEMQMNASLREISSGWNKLRIEHNFEVASYKQNYSSTKNI